MAQAAGGDRTAERAAMIWTVRVLIAAAVIAALGIIGMWSVVDHDDPAAKCSLRLAILRNCVWP
jgi:CSLREA domain-containing protein